MTEMYRRTNSATNGDSEKTNAYHLRDGHIPGKNIHIFEESDQTGGSMDAHGSPETGYIMRGGRMFDEEAYVAPLE